MSIRPVGLALVTPAKTDRQTYTRVHPHRLGRVQLVNNSVNDVLSHSPFAGLERTMVLEFRVINYYMEHIG